MKRYIKLNPADIDYFYVFWFLIVSLVFGFFGIGTGLRVANEKLRELEKMQTVKAGLLKNTETINVLAKELQKDAFAIKNLYSAIPPVPDEHNYALHLSFIARSHGFTLIGIEPLVENDRLFVFATFSGTGDIAELIKSIESQRRFTKITSIGVLHVTDGYNVQLSMEAYFAGL